MKDNTIINQTEYKEKVSDSGVTKKKKNKQKQTSDSSRRSSGVTKGAAAFGIGKLIMNAVQSDEETKVIVFRPAIDTDEEIPLETRPETSFAVSKDVVAVKVEVDEHEPAFEMEVFEKGVSGLPFAQNVDDSMSFKTAFASARQELGTGGLFIWHGKPYGTFYGSELKEMSIEEREQYVESVRYSLEQLEHSQEQEAEFEAREEIPLVEKLQPRPAHRIDSINSQETASSETEVSVEVEDDDNIYVEEDDNNYEDGIIVEIVQDEEVAQEVLPVIEENPINVEVEVEIDNASNDESIGDDYGSHLDYDVSASIEIDEALPIDNGMNMDEFFDNDIFDSI